ncbi:A-macroglobulin complement component [Halocaridina rubra]|uniref:A-macroglobulin complement component n=1 Tax=Halocaridina rubra TaxID=373956 RepID=A0AAN8XFM9_HALRR
MPEAPEAMAPAGAPDYDDKGEEDAKVVEAGLNEARTYFPETWLWKLLIVDEDGETSEDVILPDTITEWVGEAVCAHPQLGIGLSSPSSITTFTPFFMDLAVPSLARQGESIPVRVSIFNYFDQNLSVLVTLEQSSEYTAPSYSGSACVPASGKSVLTFVVTASEVGMINLTFSADIDTTDNACGGVVNITKRDVVVKPLRVQFAGVMKEKTFSDYVCHNDSEVTWLIETPEGIVDGSERIFVSVSADLLGPTLENLGNLIRMPYGCGEQNMLNFAPNIFILQYLEATNQMTTDIEQKSIDYMISGYQRELLYRRRDGSYSAFGDSDDSGSTWLTAFVLKSFVAAAEYITVDQSDLDVSRNWIYNLQNSSSGCFASVGRVIHKDMKGGIENSEDPQIPLTAYVLIALLEGNPTVTSATISAIGCISSVTSTSTYVNALKAYALALAGNTNAGALIDSVYNELNAGISGLPEAILVETAGYLLLAMLMANPSGYVGQSVNIVKLISSHRNGQGGFVSTQDTVVALQALAEFSKVYPPSDTNLDLTVTAGDNILDFSITNENLLVLQTKDVATSPPFNATVLPSGQGCAVVMVVHRYNVPDETENTAFNLSLEVDSTNCSSATVEICASYVLQGESNMAVMTGELPTGISVSVSSLEDLLVEGVIKRYEIDGGVVNLYFDLMSAEQTCFAIGVQRDFIVENAEPGTITLYDYYEPSYRITQELSIIEVCNSSTTTEVSN